MLIQPRSGRKFGRPDRVLAVGIFEAHNQPSRWAYWAEAETEHELLCEKDGRGRLLDLAVLRPAASNAFPARTSRRLRSQAPADERAAVSGDEVAGVQAKATASGGGR